LDAAEIKIRNITINCPAGYYIKDIKHIGMLYKYNKANVVLQTGKNRCIRVNDPGFFQNHNSKSSNIIDDLEQKTITSSEE